MRKVVSAARWRAAQRGGSVRGASKSRVRASRATLAG
jgi:hypothetical protein